jgi:type I restriction-modification system DNA methylase subunit
VRDGTLSKPEPHLKKTQDEPRSTGYRFILGNVPFGLKVDEDKRRSEVIWVERCLNWIEFRAAIIVPDSLLGCTRDKPIRAWILSNFGYRATISISSGKNAIFWNSSAKTSIIIIDKRKPPGNYKILMAIAEKTEELKPILEPWHNMQ